MSKRMTKKEMATEIAEKWDKETTATRKPSLQWRINDMTKRWSWSKLARIYEMEIGKVRGVNY